MFTPGGARLLDGLEAAVVFQRFASGVTKAAEVFVQGVFTLDETFVQRLQQPMLGFGGGRPVNQRTLFQRLEFNGQPGCIDGGTQRAFAENGAGGAVKAVEKQTAGRRIRAVALGVTGKHRMQRADRQRLGTTLAGYPGEVLQRLGVTKPAVAGAAQAIQLHAQAPGSGDRVVHGIGHAVATGRGHGESEVLSVHTDLLIADRYQPR
ncbi:hypothetical protein D3C78_955350 [compost metagenome]